MAEKEKPRRWQDIPSHERDAIIEWARLPEKQRCRIIRAGKNIEWWDGLVERAGSWKLVIAFVAAIVGYAAGGLDWLIALFEDMKGGGPGNDGWPQ